MRIVSLIVIFALPSMAARPTPRLLADADDLARIEALAKSEPWAAAVRNGILQNAVRWPDAHKTRYGLSEWKLPPDGGQWTHYYVCPTHGAGLQNRAPGQNVCPIDNRNYTGWPYDQVVYSYRHSDNGGAARDNALAYRFTGEQQYAKNAARILLAYADVYSSYALKDTNNRQTASAARVFAQTLDESVWLMPVAWAYDLISDSGVLSPGERAHIERDLLRAAVTVINRNNAGISNWQSWHNGAIGAVGFALDDADLITQAIDGRSGFRYQMKNSVLSDGAWYEGAWSYHFYALDPLTQLAEMAARAGIDLWSDRALRSMFEAPLRMAGPDLNLPAFNDSGAVSLVSSDRLYELAYARYRDPIFAGVLGRRTRGKEALFWGAAELPSSTTPALPAAVFPASGNAMLRAGGSDHYIAMKFGPHGGGHGHYDKLGFVSYARGTTMAVDPGTQPYAAPTHNTWDKMTVAHNTVVVDQATQAEATGELKGFAALPGISAARAAAGTAYKQASLERTMILTAEYAIDAMAANSREGAEHRFDWVYHNNGVLSTPLQTVPGAGFPANNGYQHLTNARTAATGEDWTATFDANDPSGTYGSVFTSPGGIPSRFEYTREQSVAGAWSGRMSYDFSATQGYAVYSTPVLTLAAEVPSQISLAIYGDGSGHRLTLRIYDATDERFVYTVGNIDWTGWRTITVKEPATWSHYLGNDNGVIDGGVRTVALELGSVAGGTGKGALYVDEIRLTYPAAGEVVAADFERTMRSLRVWMLGEPGTTVVTGNGLGPDLQKPVPFVMARRRGTSALFLSVLEPYGQAPSVKAFRAESAESFVVAGSGFDDRVSFDGAGALRYIRRRDGEVVRLGLANADTLQDGFRTLVRLERAGAVQVDFADGALDVQTDAAGEVRIYAPGAGKVMVNGVETAFTRDGAEVTFTIPEVSR
jgi:hypothetical protein